MKSLSLTAAILGVAVTGLWGQTPICARGVADDQAVQIQVTFSEPPDAIRTAVRETLVDLGYDIDAAQTRPDYWVTRPDFRWPPGTEEESWHGGTHPGLQLFAVIRLASADSTSLTIAAKVLCIVESQELDNAQGGISSLLEMMGSLFFVNGVRERLEERR